MKLREAYLRAWLLLLIGELALITVGRRVLGALWRVVE
jgi:hypothetical protein